MIISLVYASGSWKCHLALQWKELCSSHSHLLRTGDGLCTAYASSSSSDNIGALVAKLWPVLQTPLSKEERYWAFPATVSCSLIWLYDFVFLFYHYFQWTAILGFYSSSQRWTKCCGGAILSILNECFYPAISEICMRCPAHREVGL